MKPHTPFHLVSVLQCHGGGLLFSEMMLFVAESPPKSYGGSQLVPSTYLCTDCMIRKGGGGESCRRFSEGDEFEPGILDSIRKERKGGLNETWTGMLE